MIIGIITAFLFITVCLRSAEKRIFKKRGIFTKIHVPASIGLGAAIIAHIAFVFPLFMTRSVLVLITGFAAGAFILTVCFCAMIKKMKLHRLFVICSACFIVLHIFFNITDLIGYQNQVKNTVITNVDLSGIPDGVYTGEYDVMFIYAKVNVTVRSGEITGITILEHRTERGQTAESIIDEIVSRQKIDVDAVTHATNSSIVIQKAVENALSVAF